MTQLFNSQCEQCESEKFVSYFLQYDSNNDLERSLEQDGISSVVDYLFSSPKCRRDLRIVRSECLACEHFEETFDFSFDQQSARKQFFVNGTGFCGGLYGSGLLLSTDGGRKRAWHFSTVNNVVKSMKVDVTQLTPRAFPGVDLFSLSA